MKFLASMLISLLFVVSVKAESNLKQATINSLNFMASTYSTTYSPAPWKQQFDNWDLQLEYQAALDKINQAENLDVKKARRILMDFVYSMRDYHVSIRFDSTEKAQLAFTVRSAEGRFFIAHIDRKKLAWSDFPFNVGDEVITFAGKPVADAVNELKIYEANVAETDQALAELALTLRRASRGMPVPRGAVVIGIKKRGSQEVENRQMIWDYSPEMVLGFRGDSKKFAFPFAGEKEVKPEIPDFKMDADVSGFTANPQGLGDKDGFLPNLGTPIWSNTIEDLYRAYIYKSSEGELIGVVRIPGYIVKDYTASVKNFEKIIGHMEKVTDKLVIDQLNNPGGSVFYLYTLASMLSDRPLQAPKHKMSITPKGVASCVNTVSVLKNVKSTDAAKKVIGERLSGFPVNLQFVQFYMEYCNAIVEDWENGQTMTRPFWIAGVDQINPNSVNYTKPILILVNELDFSGGDFFPTIMQDNKRAKIMGVRTAGAGGYVLGYSHPNLLGVQTFRVTESLAYRVDQNPIENLGVTPDIPVSITVGDRQGNYRDFLKSIKAAVKDLN